MMCSLGGKTPRDSGNFDEPNRHSLLQAYGFLPLRMVLFS